MKYASKFWEFINKDVANANETKKVAVITRLYALIMCVYFAIIMLLVTGWKPCTRCGYRTGVFECVCFFVLLQLCE